LSTFFARLFLPNIFFKRFYSIIFLDIPSEWLKKWEKASPLKEFNLPSPNIFLTEDFTILDEDENHPDYPEKISSSELAEIWYRKDQKFKLPKAYYVLYLINPVALETPQM
jgi:nardilysin